MYVNNIGFCRIRRNIFLQISNMKCQNYYICTKIQIADSINPVTLSVTAYIRRERSFVPHENDFRYRGK